MKAEAFVKGKRSRSHWKHSRMPHYRLQTGQRSDLFLFRDFRRSNNDCSAVPSSNQGEGHAQWASVIFSRILMMETNYIANIKPFWPGRIFNTKKASTRQVNTGAKTFHLNDIIGWQSGHEIHERQGSRNSCSLVDVTVLIRGESGQGRAVRPAITAVWSSGISHLLKSSAAIPENLLGKWINSATGEGRVYRLQKKAQAR